MPNSLFSPAPEQLQIQDALAWLGAQLPALRWLALVTDEGLIVGTFPAQLSLAPDRIGAMSAALTALGERIASELESGALQYHLLAGAEGLTLLLVLSPTYALTLGLQRGASVPLVFETLAARLPRLMQTLQVPNLTWL